MLRFVREPVPDVPHRDVACFGLRFSASSQARPLTARRSYLEYSPRGSALKASAGPCPSEPWASLALNCTQSLESSATLWLLGGLRARVAREPASPAVQCA